MVTKKVNRNDEKNDTQSTINGGSKPNLGDSKSHYDIDASNFYRIEGHQGIANPLTDCVMFSGAKDKNCNGIDDAKELAKAKNDRRLSERLRHKSRD